VQISVSSAGNSMPVIVYTRVDGGEWILPQDRDETSDVRLYSIEVSRSFSVWANCHDANGDLELKLVNATVADRNTLSLSCDWSANVGARYTAEGTMTSAGTVFVGRQGVGRNAINWQYSLGSDQPLVDLVATTVPEWSDGARRVFRFNSVNIEAMGEDFPLLDLAAQGVPLLEESVPLIGADVSDIHARTILHTSGNTIAELGQADDLRVFVPDGGLQFDDLLAAEIDIVAGNTMREYDIVNVAASVGPLRVLDVIGDSILPSNGQQAVTVPDVDGQIPTTAELILEDVGMRASVVAFTGWIESQQSQLVWETPLDSLAPRPQGSQRRMVRLRVDEAEVRRSTSVTSVAN